MSNQTCTRNTSCPACKTLRTKILARLDGKTGRPPIPFDPVHLYTTPQTYPVIFSVPEAHVDNPPAAVVAELDRELKPLGSTRIKMEINEVKKYLFYGDQFPLHLWDVTVPSPVTCPLLLRLQFFSDNLKAVQEVEMPTARDVLGIVEEGMFEKGIDLRVRG
ncbi:uncharacterized protein BDV14DRAFT_195435 [Aspergillus stella-maris]|uniref:uncharacterized protein n=1 Tax=Aspergillus stella-maris TaxID=1810926 RepID=UPI003CCD2C1C